MRKIKPIDGMVGFFDILGYSSFLENNEPEEAANTVLEILLNAPKKVCALHTSIFKGHALQGELEAYIKKIKWLIFSDTILATSSYRKPSDNASKSIDWTFFTATIIMLYRHLFDSGLPVRGALAFGKHVIKHQCFVGRPIIDAYKTSQSLDLAAVTLHNSALTELGKIQVQDNSPTLFDSLTTEYLVPLRNATSAKQRLLKPSFAILPPADISDVRQFVSASFWKHKKDIAPEVISKLNNTEQFFRFCLMTSPKSFGKIRK